MIEEKFDKVYRRFKLNFYKNILGSDERKEANLTVSESFCAELIDSLDQPTIGDLVKFLKVAQPNITYRVNSLVKKGYVEKVNSKVDKRIVHLRVTQKYKDYQSFKNSYAREVIKMTEANLEEDEIQVLEKVLSLMADELVLNVNKQQPKSLGDNTYLEWENPWQRCTCRGFFLSLVLLTFRQKIIWYYQ